MRRVVALIMGLLMLTGCETAKTYEMVADEWAEPAAVDPRQIHFFLAEDMVMPVMESDGGKLYLCEEYDVMSQILEGGDLQKSVQKVSGYLPEELTIIQTASGEVDKYEFVWTGSSDEGQQIGRATLLDDGHYHYVLSATIQADRIEEYQEIWNGIFESFKLV